MGKRVIAMRYSMKIIKTKQICQNQWNAPMKIRGKFIDQSLTLGERKAKT